ncbi:hypothetical protein CBOM_04196 [Ceraceosorus bombacis]|uniref:Uncharacterized protein n=1 Tax=Ceraceosorus bombacis TaxID=401625 RepID=A0A0P1BM51_9BASI|nr:hypothetical protein CBOM_04196 [Ceraceosorus bombacis]
MLFFNLNVSLLVVCGLLVGVSQALQPVKIPAFGFWELWHSSTKEVGGDDAAAKLWNDKCHEIYDDESNIVNTDFGTFEKKKENGEVEVVIAFYCHSFRKDGIWFDRTAHCTNMLNAFELHDKAGWMGYTLAIPRKG